MTASGLRPERFSENKPGGPTEGLEFDWGGGQVTFDRNGEKVGELKPTEANKHELVSMIVGAEG